LRAEARVIAGELRNRTDSRVGVCPMRQETMPRVAKYILEQRRALNRAERIRVAEPSVHEAAGEATSDADAQGAPTRSDQRDNEFDAFHPALTQLGAKGAGRTGDEQGLG
jgi:hypothetical protein